MDRKGSTGGKKEQFNVKLGKEKKGIETQNNTNTWPSVNWEKRLWQPQGSQ